MTTTFTIAALLILPLALIVLFFILQKKWSQKFQKNITELKTFETENIRLVQSENHLTQIIEELKQKLHQETSEKESERTQRIQLTTKLEAAEQVIQSEQSLLEKAHDSFKSLAAEVLEGSNKNFLQLAKTTLEKQTIQNSGELENKKVAIEELVKPLNTSLLQYQNKVIELEKNREKTHGLLENELNKINQNHKLLAQTTQTLKDALKKPHVRGRWGEVQLKNCIEMAGMSEFSDVTFQDNVTLESGERLIPDMVVRMPGEKKVIVDAKTPIEAFMTSLEATEEESRYTEMIRHGKHVKKHIQDLSTKDYAKNIKNSADFTVMFLPNESFLYAALEVEPDLMEYALQRKVLIATPPTLIGLLKVIRYGWNEEKLAENAQKISDAGKELHKRVCDFMEAYTSVGNHLEKAQEEYDKGLTRLKSRVLVQTKRLEKLGAKSTKNLPEKLLIQEPQTDDA